MSIKEILLNKGWAGRTISRPETVIQLNPHIQTMVNLLHAYNILAERDSGGYEKSSMGDQVRILRMDIGKMSETISSCGGIPERSPQSSIVRGSAEWSDIVAVEKSLLNMILAEKEIEHQMRTRAILSKVQENTEALIQQLQRTVQT